MTIPKPSPDIARRTYTQADVAELFGIDYTTVYKKPQLMACRISSRPVRYSMKLIDAILNGEHAETPTRGTKLRRSA